MEIFVSYGAALLLAFGVEFAIETYFIPLFDNIPFVGGFRWLLPYVAGGASVGLAYYYQLDAPALILGSEASVVGMIFTGLFVGGGADAVHKFFRKYILDRPSS